MQDALCAVEPENNVRRTIARQKTFVSIIQKVVCLCYLIFLMPNMQSTGTLNSKENFAVIITVVLAIVFTV